jgi:hypothetical protein
MTARFVTSAVLGALAAVVGWAAWSALGPHESSESALPAEASVAQVALPAPVAATAPQRLVEPAGAAPQLAPPPSPPSPRLRDGFVMEHGMPVANHALAGDDGAAELPPPTVALPAGVQAEDAVVNRAGMVTLMRSGDASATGDAASTTPTRAATVTRVP